MLDRFYKDSIFPWAFYLAILSTLFNSYTHQHYLPSLLELRLPTFSFNFDFLLELFIDLLIDTVFLAISFFGFWHIVKFGAPLIKKRLSTNRLPKSVFLILCSVPLILSCFLGLRIFYEILDYTGHLGALRWRTYQVTQKSTAIQKNHTWKLIETTELWNDALEFFNTKDTSGKISEKHQEAQKENKAEIWEFGPISSKLSIRLHLNDGDLFFHPNPQFFYGYPNPGRPFFAVSAHSKDSLTAFPSLQAFLAEPEQSSPHALAKIIKKAMAVRTNSQEISDVSVYHPNYQNYQATAKANNADSDHSWLLQRKKRMPAKGTKVAQLGASAPDGPSALPIPIEPIFVQYSDRLTKKRMQMQIFVDPEFSAILSQRKNDIQVVFVAYQLDTYGNSLHPKLKRLLRQILWRYDF